jgi:5-deoxy-glucuronate isomerase
MKLKHRYTPVKGYSQLVAPRTHALELLEFGVLSLDAGEAYAGKSEGRETGLVILTGTCSVRCGADQYEGIGGRQSVFDGRATAVYVALGADFSVEAGAEGVEIAVCRCATEQRHRSRLVCPEQVVARERGGAGFTRYVHDVIGPNVEAAAILVGETFTPAGNWSGYPPHKHDQEDLPHEVAQEEVYFYKLRPQDGFGIQYVYSPGVEGGDRPPIDEAHAVRHNDFSVISYGYHPVAAPPGYDVYYLWFLAGRTRLMLPHDDPAHGWIAAGDGLARHYPR